ncbi:MAG: transporter substrate-binding domain-containing protein, partial [Clostridium sp.]|nr:transporter substrate-binding domain-containing protein [Clostridium sp.]
MKKKVTAMAMTMAVMAASLTACSSKSAAPAETTAAATEAAKETEAASEAPAETEAAAAESDSVEGALKGVKLKFGTTALFAPFTYYDTDGTTLIGFDVEFMEALKDYLGFELDGDIQVMDYSALTTSL